MDNWLTPGSYFNYIDKHDVEPLAIFKKNCTKIELNKNQITFFQLCVIVFDWPMNGRELRLHLVHQPSRSYLVLSKDCSHESLNLSDTPQINSIISQIAIKKAQTGSDVN